MIPNHTRIKCCNNECHKTRIQNVAKWYLMTHIHNVAQTKRMKNAYKI